MKHATLTVNGRHVATWKTSSSVPAQARGYISDEEMRKPSFDDRCWFQGGNCRLSIK
ncbi:hypothetical protein [Neptuniibacter sp. QD37_11]|uniref:hypothetical protein n=1 Tax=Neptuniibacter sp. QD37_11 TaxID=3398209 RepID=UPI0039F5B0E8